MSEKDKPKVRFTPSGTPYVEIEDEREALKRRLVERGREYIASRGAPIIYKQATTIDEWPGEYEGTTAYFDNPEIKREADELKWWPREEAEETPKRDPDAWRQAEGVIELDEPAEVIIRRWRDGETKD